MQYLQQVSRQKKYIIEVKPYTHIHSNDNFCTNTHIVCICFATNYFISVPNVITSKNSVFIILGGKHLDDLLLEPRF